MKPLPFAALLALDADGTLLNSKRLVCPRAWAQLQRLQHVQGPRVMGAAHPARLQTSGEARKGAVLRVIATGRNLRSILHVLPTDTPVDYVIAGSGGICIRWPHKDIVFTHGMSNATAIRLCEYLMALGTCHFFVLRRPPEHHKCLAYRCTALPTSSHETEDFNARCSIYAEFTQDITSADELHRLCSEDQEGFCGQFLLMGPCDVLTRLAQDLKAVFGSGQLRTVRTTSPTDHRVTWLEIFPPEVSKSNGIAYLAKAHSIPSSGVVAVGNDYNDEDMLEHAGVGLLVANAPLEMRQDKRFVSLSRTNDDGGVAEAIERYFPSAPSDQ